MTQPHAHTLRPDPSGPYAFRCADCGAVQVRPPVEPSYKAPPKVRKSKRTWMERG